MIIQKYLPLLGGAERQLAATAPLLQNRGIDVVVVTRRHRGLSAFETIAGIPVYRLPAPPPKPLASLTFTLSAMPLLRRLQPSLVHAYGIFSTASTALLAKRFYGLPVVVKLLRSGAQHGDVDRLGRKILAQRRLRALQHEVDAFITISRELDDELAQIRVPRERRRFIPNGVDTSRFHRASPNARKSWRQTLDLPAGLMVLFTGRLDPEKRIDQLISIWPAIRDCHPDAFLVVVGTGIQEQALRAMASERIFFTGQIEDVAPYLQAADLFALPSVAEGLSNALLEAMASALPVVATDVGGNTDVITHDHDGWLVPPDDPMAFAKAIRTLLFDRARRIRLGDGARQRVIAHYGLTTTAKRLQQLYEEILVGRCLDPR
jgi:glycosyltransferase involved in cell wall biosynthesis